MKTKQPARKKCGNPACGKSFSKADVEKWRRRHLSASEWTKTKFCSRVCSDRIQGRRIANAKVQIRETLRTQKKRAGVDGASGAPVYRLPAGASGRRI